MNRYEKIRQEIEQIENELRELRSTTGNNRMNGTLKELSMKNDRIKSAFTNISTTINAR
jgi:hypothetical protein